MNLKLVEIIFNKPSISYLEKIKIPKETILDSYVKNYNIHKSTNQSIANKLFNPSMLYENNQNNDKISNMVNYSSKFNNIVNNNPFSSLKVENKSFVKIIENNVSYESIVGRLLLNPSEIDRLNGIPMNVLPDFFVKILNSEHFAIIFSSELLPESFFVHVFTHREKIDAFFPELKREVITTSVDLLNNPRKQMITNPIFEIPSDIISISDFNNSQVINYITQNKDKILEILLKEENHVFDVGLYLNEFYNLNTNNFLSFDV